MPVDVSKEKTKKKEKRQKENIEEFVTPKKKAKTSTDSASPVNGSSLSKKKRKRQNSTSGPGVQPEQNGTLVNGTAEETTTTEKSPNANVDALQSHKKSSAKKRRKSKTGDNSLVTSSELLNGSFVKEADSSLHELTKKRRSLAIVAGELDTTGSAQKQKKKKINPAA